MIKIKDIIKLTSSYEMNTEYYILLVLIGLHKSKVISDAKLRGQFKSLRKGNLLKHKNVYHCTINDEWYNDKSPYKVFEDISEKVLDVTISFEEFIKYIQLYNNKSYNYCINVFFQEYVSTMYELWNPHYNHKIFNESRFGEVFQINGFPILYTIDNSYYCDECGHRHEDLNKDHNNYGKLNDFIHSLKRGNKNKIPRFDVKVSYGSWFR